MTDERITPEEFARLLALPESDPERQRAARSPQFEAMRAMLAEFERSPAPGVPPDVAAWARQQLASRLASGSPAAAPAIPREARATAPRPGFFDWLRAPGGRVALAVGVLAIVAGLVWRAPSRESRMRGEGDPGMFEPVVTSPAHGEVLIRWAAVPEADGYRVVFLDASLAEIASLEVAGAAEARLRRDALPAGLTPGGEASVEIVALRQGAAISTSPARTIRLP